MVHMYPRLLLMPLWCVCDHAGIKSSASLQQELAEFNNGQDFDGLEDFTYNNSGFVSLLFGHLENTDFDGITVSKSKCLFQQKNRNTVRLTMPIFMHTLPICHKLTEEINIFKVDKTAHIVSTSACTAMAKKKYPFDDPH